MAVGVLITIPGFDQQQYERVTKEMFGEYPMSSQRAPNGLKLHSAGPGQEGWYVYDIWETPEQFRRFGDEQLRPAIKQVLGEEPRGEPQFFEIESLVQPR